MRMRLYTNCVRMVRLVRCIELINPLWVIPDAPELFHGLPVGLQLIGRTQEEEAVIAMTEVVDKALKALK